MNEAGQKTILLVEDEAIIAMTESRLLKKYGFDVVTAGTGEQAVSLVETTPDIDLVLMDINLGSGIDGTVAAQRILALRDVPLVFLSSHTEKDVVESTEGITSYGYIVKNSGETVLMASIKMAFRLFESKQQEKAKRVALKESEEKYRRLIEHLPDIVYVFSDKRGCVFNSPSVATILGYSLERLYADPFLWNSSIHEDDRLRVQKSIEEAMCGIPFTMEYRIYDAAGVEHWFLDRMIERHAVDGEVLLEGFASDITDRKQKEAMLLKKIDELERMHRLTVDRELTMVDLKKDINTLLRRCGEADRYTIRSLSREP